MPVALRLLELLPPDYQPWQADTNPPVPVQMLTISGSADEREDIRREWYALEKVLGYPAQHEFSSENVELENLLSDIIFAGYLSGAQKGDSYVEWAISRKHLPIEDYPVLYASAKRYAVSIVNEPAFPVSGSIPLSVVKLADFLKKQKAYAFTALLIGGGLALGQPLSPFLVFESSVGGASSYFVLAVGTAAADRMAKYVRTIGEEKHRPEMRGRRR